MSIVHHLYNVFRSTKTLSMDVWSMSFRSLKKKSTYDGPKLEDIEDSNVSPRLQKQLALYFAGIEAEFAQVCQENEQCKLGLNWDWKFFIHSIFLI